MGARQIHPLWGLESLLAHRLVSTPVGQPNVLARTLSFLQSMWDPPPNLPPLGPSLLTGTSSCVYPLRGRASSLAHDQMSGSDTICNDLGSLLADIVLFEPFLLQGKVFTSPPQPMWDITKSIQKLVTFHETFQES